MEKFGVLPMGVGFHLNTEWHALLPSVFLGCEFRADTVDLDVNASVLRGVPEKLCPIQTVIVYVDVHKAVW